MEKNDNIVPHLILQRELDKLYPILKEHDILISAFSDNDPKSGKLKCYFSTYEKEEVGEKKHYRTYRSTILTDVDIFNNMVNIIRENLSDNINLSVKQMEGDLKIIELGLS